MESCRATDSNELLDGQRESSVSHLGSRANPSYDVGPGQCRQLSPNACNGHRRPRPGSEICGRMRPRGVVCRDLWSGLVRVCPRPQASLSNPTHLPISWELVFLATWVSLRARQGNSKPSTKNPNLSPGISVPLAAQGAKTLRNTTSEEARPTTSASTK